MLMSRFTRTVPSIQLAFIRGCFASVRATTETRRSVCDTPVNCSRAAFSAVASRCRVMKKCGTVVQLCVVRSAIRRAVDDTPDCGLRIADCGLRTLDCGPWIADCGLPPRLRIAD